MTFNEKKQPEVETDAVSAALVRLRCSRHSPRYRSFLSADAVEPFSALKVSGYTGTALICTDAGDCISPVQI